MASLFAAFDKRDFDNYAAVLSESPTTASHVRSLEFELERLRLLNQALWELIREKLGLQDMELENKAQEIDLRDGIPDQKISQIPLKCPRCGRTSSSKHWRCLYCGLEFEKPVMG